jgi:hypothetical protein
MLVRASVARGSRTLARPGLWKRTLYVYQIEELPFLGFLYECCLQLLPLQHQLERQDR